MTTTLPTVTLNAMVGGTKAVGYGHPCWDALDRTRVRVSRVVDSTSVEVTDNDGKVLPDYRHPVQLTAY